MSEYFASVVLVSSLVAFSELISFSGGKEKGERLAIYAILAYLIISPVVPLVDSLRDFEIPEFTLDSEEAGGAYIEVGKEAFTDGISHALSEKFGLRDGEYTVAVVGFDFNNMKAERIIITLLSGGYTVDFREIEEYIEKSGLGECEVEYAIK